MKGKTSEKAKDERRYMEGEQNWAVLQFCYGQSSRRQEDGYQDHHGRILAGSNHAGGKDGPESIDNNNE